MLTYYVFVRDFDTDDGVELMRDFFKSEKLLGLYEGLRRVLSEDYSRGFVMYFYWIKAK